MQTSNSSAKHHSLALSVSRDIFDQRKGFLNFPDAEQLVQVDV
jgi:hypothetical protein